MSEHYDDAEDVWYCSSDSFLSPMPGQRSRRVVHTCRAEIIQRRIGAYARVQRFDCGRHDEWRCNRLLFAGQYLSQE